VSAAVGGPDAGPDAGPPTGPPTGPLARVWRGLVWYLRAASGEDRWDAHVQACAAHGHPPGTRRAFERRRADAAAASPVQRCC
jgi:hypothetical protein